MVEFEEILLSGEKSRTNRGYSRSRNRINIGDRVQIKVGNRFKGFKKLFDAVITNKKIWLYSQAPQNPESARKMPSPKKDESWWDFAIKDGFTDYSDFLDYFDPEKHPKNKAKYIFFEFKKIEEYYSETYQSLEVFMNC